MTKTGSGGASASLFEADIEVIGDVSFSGELYLQGRVNGNIVAPNDSNASLFVEENSQVTGEIRAPLLVVSGKVSGDIYSSRRVSLKSTAEVVGNIHYTEINVEQGASINGTLMALKAGQPFPA
ncbi:MAG: polymer-forming cytoskeletal protein [Thiothrix sp.]|nr:polymer-forming cytoskeletal protein [Thiothrix sp.]HPQ95098.1 polymer-forming cytoskeletal protein [Thiolinea sp.]